MQQIFKLYVLLGLIQLTMWAVMKKYLKKKGD